MTKSFEDDRNLAIKLSRELIVINEPLLNISSCRFSPDGSKIVSCFWDAPDIKIFDAFTGDHLNTLIGPSGLAATTFSNNGAQLIAHYDFGIIKMWDTITWRCLKTLKTDGSLVYLCNFSPDDSLIVFSYYSYTINIKCASTHSIRIHSYIL